MNFRFSKAKSNRGISSTTRFNGNTSRWFRRVFVSAITLLITSSASAAIFVDIPGIPGGSLDKDHRDQIDATATGGNFTRNRCGKYMVIKSPDRATPDLIAATVSGRFFPQIVVEQTRSFVDAGRVPVSTITLNNARITRVESNMDASEPVQEILRIKPQSIDIEHREYDSRGALKATISESVDCANSSGD